MIVERSMSDQWLSNTYVVADELGGSAVMVDAGGPVAPLLEYLNRGQFDLTHVLLTHHHHDHIADLEAVLRAHPGTPVLIHERERQFVAAGDRHDGRGSDDPVRGDDDRADAYARAHLGDAVAAVRRHRRVHRRHAVQGLGRGRARA